MKTLPDELKKLLSKKPELVKKPQPEQRVRDMRQEAIDIGSHQAKEYFGEKQNG